MITFIFIIYILQMIIHLWKSTSWKDIKISLDNQLSVLYNCAISHLVCSQVMNVFKLITKIFLLKLILSYNKSNKNKFSMHIYYQIETIYTNVHTSTH